MTLLDVRAVSHAYGSGALVLSEATLAVDAYTVCGILGPNGAGKSTLARLAAGVFQPQKGSVSVAGHDLRAAEGPARARLVRVTFQTPEHELFRPTLGEELDWEAGLLAEDGTAMRARVAEMLEACGAKVALDQHPYDLDPWQRKLFCCLAALAVPGRLVILDEPTLRLGQQVRARLGAAITRYASQGGAVVFVTHDHEFASSTCQQIAVVRGGRIAAAGAADVVLASAAGHAATNIYSFPSFYLENAVKRRNAGSRSGR